MKKKRNMVFLLVLICLCLVQTVRVPFTSAQETLKLKVKAASMDSVTLSWNTIDGAKNYVIYRSEKKDSGYKKIATVTSSTYKNTNISTAKTYYYKVKVGKVESNIVKKIKVKGYDKTGKVYGTSLSAKQRKQVGNKVANFVNTKITAGMSDVEKVKTIHDYIVDHCKKAPTWREHGANTAWGALIYGEAQCSGYARAFKAICDALGIGCYHIYANSKAINPSHQWNLVKVDGNWYHIDLNCNDNSGGYVVFLLGDADEKATILMDWDSSKYPKCKKSYDTSAILTAETRKMSKTTLSNMKKSAKDLGFVWSEKYESGTINQGYVIHRVIFLTNCEKNDFDNVESTFTTMLKRYKKHFKGFELFVHVNRIEEDNEVAYYYRIGTTEEDMSEERLEEFCELLDTFQ